MTPVYIVVTKIYGDAPQTTVTVKTDPREILPLRKHLKRFKAKFQIGAVRVGSEK